MLPQSAHAADAQDASGRAAAPSAADNADGQPAAMASSGTSANDRDGRLKRLLRDAFAELVELRGRVDGLEAAAEAAAEAEASGETLVLPLYGFAVQPYTRSLAPGMALRCKAQVSGTVETAALAALAQPASGGARGDSSSSSSSPPTPRCAAAACGEPGWPALRQLEQPRLRLLLQSVWGGGKQGGAAARELGDRQRQAAGGGGRWQSPFIAAHAQIAVAEGGKDAAIEKLLVKAEVHPRLKLLAAARGCLENVARLANPFAATAGHARGLLGVTRRGHDLPVLDEGGLGLAAAASLGPLSLAVGAFGDGASGGCGGTGAAAAPAVPGAHMQCGQLSLHSSRRLALSAVWSSGMQQQPCVPPAHWSSASGAPELAQVVQQGVSGAVRMGERLALSAWAASSCSTACPRTPAGSRRCSDSDPAAPPPALAISPRPKAAASRQQQQQQQQPAAEEGARSRSHRAGVRVALMPHEDTGRSYALAVSTRSTAGGTEVAAEASACVPLASGVVLTPGVVLLRAPRAACEGCVSQASVYGAAQVTWSF